MTNRADRRQRLEHLMQRALAELPPRRAPASLERRVIDTIEDRARRAPQQESTWRDSFRRGRGFASWPAAVRAALIACCLASVVVVSLGLKAVAIELAMLPADPRIAARLQALQGVRETAVALGALLGRLTRIIPPEWLLGGLLATALIYSLLFSLVAIGYSTLYVTPERSRP